MKHSHSSTDAGSCIDSVRNHDEIDLFAVTFAVGTQTCQLLSMDLVQSPGSTLTDVFVKAEAKGKGISSNQQWHQTREEN